MLTLANMLTLLAGFSYKLHRLSPGCRGHPSFQDDADSAGPPTSPCNVQDARDEGNAALDFKTLPSASNIHSTKVKESGSAKFLHFNFGVT